MKLNRNDYTVEAAAGGGFYAYFMNNVLCSAYGETPDEACENLEQIHSINSLEVMSARCRCDFCHL